MRRLIRWIVWSLVSLLALAALAVVAVRWYSGPDEAASDLARRWQTPLPATVPDDENAWLHLIGLGADKDDEPPALGRRRGGNRTFRAKSVVFEAIINQSVILPIARRGLYLWGFRSSSLLRCWKSRVVFVAQA